MKIHAIQTGTVALHELQRAGRGRGPARALRTMLDRNWTDQLPILAWAIEHPEGVIVVDTGETARVMQPGYFPAWHPYFRLAVRIEQTAHDEVGPQLRRLGIDPSDVRWVVMTHLHTDHAGGLAHFPDSEILVTGSEFDYASGTAGKLRGYLPHRWPGWFTNPTRVEFDGDPFGPFERSRTLTEAGDVVLLPTPGHTPGHLSVAVRDGERIVFLAGDTSYTEQLMVDGAADGLTNDPRTSEQTLERIRRLAADEQLVYLPTHDPASAGRLSRG